MIRNQSGTTGGADLNRRPLGYEGNSEREAIQDEPSQAKDDDDLGDSQSVRLWAGSVRLLHSYFTARRTPSQQSVLGRGITD